MKRMVIFRGEPIRGYRDVFWRLKIATIIMLWMFAVCGLFIGVIFLIDYLV